MNKLPCFVISTILVLFSIGFATPLEAKKEVKAAPLPPPYIEAYQPRGVDEVGIWRQDDEREQRLAKSSLLIRDEKLNVYIRDVFCRTVGDDRCKSVRIYLVRLPVFNATMSPNGTMTIFSGLLLRARSEAELAAVLGHEFGHFEKRHSLNQFKDARKKTDLLSWAAVLTSMSGSSEAYRAFDNLQLSVLGGFYRNKRNHEREADLLGLGYLNASSLRPQAASSIWRNLILEAEASAAMRGLRKPKFNRHAFFASHPSDGERADYLYALADQDGLSRDDGAKRYIEELRLWTPKFLDDQIALNDFGATDFIINRIGEAGWTAELWRARGDLFRSRGLRRDLMNAADYYANAVRLKPELAEAQRGLGLSLVKTGRISEGVSALRSYLKLEPNASDKAMVIATIELLELNQ